MTRNTLAWLRGAINVEASDVPNLFWSFLWFFFVLAAFYTVRPMRETYATRVGDVQQLFLATFICMLLASPVYNALLDRVSRAKLIPIAYRFFSLWLIGFAIASIVFPEPPFAFCAIFFVWVSVFNLFVVTIFWSVLSDRYSSAQGKNFFGAIAAGGSLGALAASLLVSNFDSRSGNWLLLLLTVVLLELAIWCAYRLEQSPTTFETGDTPVALLEQDQPDQVAMEPGILSSFVSVFQSPYLLGIVGFLLLGKWCATSVYLEQVDMVKQQVSDAAERQQMFARENWLVQIGTLIFQLGLTRPLIRWIELPLTLAVLPLTLAIGFFWVATWPTLDGIFALQIGQRVLTYGLMGPAREILFTVATREEKYKSKGLIDTAIFRAGDTLSAYLHTAMKSNLPGQNPSWWMIPICVIWGILGLCIGGAQRRRTVP